MEIYHLEHDLTVYGFPVETFPEGIGEAFDKLINLLPPAGTRPYYGISACTPVGILYLAAALIKPDEKPEQYSLQAYVINKGNYLAEKVVDWQSKTQSINGIFRKMVEDSRCDQIKPCVEVYLNDQEMLCLVKAVEMQNQNLEKLHA